jgi:ubiquinone/menaquinone biosynthesis C-methylase UbiE
MTVHTQLDDVAPARRVQDGVAQVYDRASGYYRSPRWERNRLARFERTLTGRTLEDELGGGPVDSALEIGCGPGTWTGLLAERARGVLAVDLSPGMLAQARAAVTADHVRFLNADAATLDPGEQFDLLMSVRVLEYVPEWRDVVHRFGRLLRPGGRAVVVTKTPVSVYRGTGRERWFGPHTLARTLTGRRLDEDFWQRHIPVRGLVAAFREAGLVDVSVRPVILGLPIYMRGTKQYPLLPRFAEGPALRLTDATWRWVSGRGPAVRSAVLPLSESYAVSGRRP